MRFLFGTVLLIGGILYSLEGFQVAFSGKEIDKTFVLLSSIVAALAFYTASFDFLRKYKIFKVLEDRITDLLVKMKVIQQDEEEVFEKIEIEETFKEDEDDRLENEAFLPYAHIKIDFRRDEKHLYYQTTCLCGHQRERIFSKKANTEEEVCPNCGSSIDITFHF